jgi:amidase
MLEPLNRFLVESAAGISSIEHMRALGSIHTYVRRAVTFWDDYDVLLTPTLASPPVPVGWMFSDEDPMGQLMRSGQFIPYTAFANISGQPAVSVPLHWNDEGLPIGVQLIGGPADESTLIKLSGQLERAEPWADRRPPEGRAATSQ